MKMTVKRMVSFLLALCMCLIMLPAVTMRADAATQTVFHQTDSPWGDYPYKYNDKAEEDPATIGSSGCALLALVNAVHYLTGNFIDPIILAEFAIDNGYRVSGSGTLQGFFAGYSKVNGAQYGYSFDGKYTGSANDERLIEHLKNGGVAIGRVPRHYMALVGYDTSTNKFHVYDSAPSSKRGTNTNDGDVWLSQSVLTKGDTEISWYCLLSSTCDHKFVDNDTACGICSKCNYIYNWKSTFEPADAGIYKLLDAAYDPRTEPYSKADKRGICISPNSVQVIGSVKNAYGNKWYWLGSWDDPYFVYHTNMELIKHDAAKVTCTNFAPANNATIKKATYNLTGTVKSNYSLKSIEGYLDGTKYATWTASDKTTMTVNLKDTVINKSLKFASLSTGKHTITLKAYSYNNSTAVSFHTSIFYVDDASCSHSYSYKVSKTPTTSAAGSLTGTCSKCSGTTTATLPKLTTTDYAYKVTKAATCTATGTGRYTWKTTTYGSFYFDVSIPATGHNYTGKVTAPTCTAQGYTTYTCSICSNSYKDGYTNATSHSYAYKATTNPTTSATGILTGTCSKCSGTTTVKLPKLTTTDYSYAVTKAATCTATGTGRYTWKTTAYGSFYFDVSIPTTGHSCVGRETAPTCTKQGYMTYYCLNCSFTCVDRYTDATGHSYSYKATTNPTISAAGTLTGTCSKCSGTTTVTLPKLDAANYTYMVTTEPSYTATGTGSYTWNTTSYGIFRFDVTLDKLVAILTRIEVESVPAKTEYTIGENLDTTGLKLKLIYSDDSTKTVTTGFTVSDFSFVDAGTKTMTVTYEDKTTTFNVTVTAPKPEIDEKAPQIIIESKTATNGKDFTVTAEIKNNPGFSYLEVTPVYSSELTLVQVKNGELISDFTKGKQYVWVSDEDVTGDGLLLTFTFRLSEDVEPGSYQVSFNVRTCANYNEDIVTLNVVDGVIEVNDCIYGDVNGDGTVDGFDVIRLKKYLANYDYDAETSIVGVGAGADANGDGKINGFDVIRLKKYLANYDYESGESTIVLGPQ